ncbi:MAG: tRNA dihydrouridine(20/20a) synthase DusA [Ectothiorhodospiraceae bacterium]|nr:tRNA dihydrouridine(20/20a) synthase DusA [Chromatiales bacterium]MCP5157542.1 tRNA dihydrouridine(20/20a) synthase DusA [Ectothiorhodospiraceae bacterium]
MTAPDAPRPTRAAELDRRLSVAPMMDCTDRHFRVLARLISRRTLLYTEMVTTAALLHGDVARHLDFDPTEHPLALQLGGSEPGDMAACARLAEQWGYDEVNINVGCPSDRVQEGRFGACLMAEPERVADCVVAMREATRLPVTVKCRLGIDDRDRYEDLQGFVHTVAAAGCRTFVVHARKAILSGLSPRQNREIPPLHHDRVHRLKRERPDLEIVVNGGFTSLEQVAVQLRGVDGVMIGREAYKDPYLLATADGAVFGERASPPSRHEVARAFIAYVEGRLAAGDPLLRVARHALGLFHRVPGARAWRRRISDHATRPGAGIEVLERALGEVPDEAFVAARERELASRAG